MSSTPEQTVNEALPPGVSPHDQRSEIGGAGWSNRPTPESKVLDRPRGRSPFSTDNAHAMGVFQRASQTFNISGIRVKATNPQKLVSRRSGRITITIAVPLAVVVGGTLVTLKTTTDGVLIAQTSGESQMNAGWLLGVGDSISLPTESGIWVAVIPGNALGYCQWIEFINPAAESPGT